MDYWKNLLENQLLQKNNNKNELQLILQNRRASDKMPL